MRSYQSFLWISYHVFLNSMWHVYYFPVFCSSCSKVARPFCPKLDLTGSFMWSRQNEGVGTWQQTHTSGLNGGLRRWSWLRGWLWKHWVGFLVTSRCYLGDTTTLGGNIYSIIYTKMSSWSRRVLGLCCQWVTKAREAAPEKAHLITYLLLCL